MEYDEFDGLPIGQRYQLRRFGYFTIAALRKAPDADLLNVYKMGPKRLERLRAWLKAQA